MVKSIQYTDVKRCSIRQLNIMGEDGWKPATLIYEETQYDAGWTGLLWREVNPDDSDKT